MSEAPSLTPVNAWVKETILLYFAQDPDEARSAASMNEVVRTFNVQV